MKYTYCFDFTKWQGGGEDLSTVEITYDQNTKIKYRTFLRVAVD